jgi:acyl carrier protein
MTRTELIPAVARIASSVIGEGDLDITPETAFASVEGWDSLNHLHIVVGLEKAFGIRFADSARLQSATTVGDLLDMISSARKP